MTYAKPLALLAGVLLLLAVPSIWPYAYFQVLRFVVAIAALVAGYHAYKKREVPWVWVMGGVAVLFDPIAPVYLSKGTWVMLDVVAAVIFFVFVVSLKNRRV